MRRATRLIQGIVFFENFACVVIRRKKIIVFRYVMLVERQLNSLAGVGQCADLKVRKCANPCVCKVHLSARGCEKVRHNGFWQRNAGAVEISIEKRSEVEISMEK